MVRIIVSRQKFSLEPVHLASGSAVALDGLAANDPAHRGIASKAVGVVHVLVAGETTEDRLAQQTDHASRSCPSDVGKHRSPTRVQPSNIAPWQAVVLTIFINLRRALIKKVKWLMESSSPTTA